MDWPPHRADERRWVPATRKGKRHDKQPRTVEVALPPLIARLSCDSAGKVARAQEAAVIAVARLEAGHGRHLPALAEFLLWSESVASAKIERVDAGWRAFGKAIAGGKANDDAKSQLAAVRALSSLVATADAGPITLQGIIDAHGPGGMRTTQTWIGASDSSPIGADYVPPPPESVPALMKDLVVFANRTDVPILAQAAIAHAQFESIRPFTDGNGQVGRALISAMLRRRGLTRQVTVPVSSAMLADTHRYVAQFAAYRTGDAGALVRYVADAARHASEAAEESAERLAGLPKRWRSRARPRAGSADETLIAGLLETPIFTAETAQQITGTTDASTYKALKRLTESGILELLFAGKRNRVWAARDVLAELDTLSKAIGRRAAS